jgi:hypothetical protein
VETALIPDEGRDVQCSGCGFAWFVAHPDQIAAEENEQALFDPPPNLPPTSTPNSTAGVNPTIRPVDQAILDVLREESAREITQRRAETRPVIESQTEFGLQGADSNAPSYARPGEPASAYDSGPISATAEKVARLKGVSAPPPHAPAASGAPAASKRSDLLPGIDEINSSLRPASEKRPGAGAAVAKTMPGKAGFGRGFMFGLLIWALIVAGYVMAPELSRQIPAIASLLGAFVAFVDGIRTAIAQMIGQLVAMLGGLIQ